MTSKAPLLKNPLYVRIAQKYKRKMYFWINNEEELYFYIWNYISFCFIYDIIASHLKQIYINRKYKNQSILHENRREKGKERTFLITPPGSCDSETQNIS